MASFQLKHLLIVLVSQESPCEILGVRIAAPEEMIQP